jgi:hypothetical protein
VIVISFKPLKHREWVFMYGRDGRDCSIRNFSIEGEKNESRKNEDEARCESAGIGVHLDVFDVLYG